MNATPNTLTPELLQMMDAYWRAANYLSVGQIYLFDNPLLRRPCRSGHQAYAAGTLGDRRPGAGTSFTCT